MLCYEVGKSLTKKNIKAVEEWEEENHCPINLTTTRGTVAESHLLWSKPNPHLGGI